MKKTFPLLILTFAVALNLYWLYPETKAVYDVNDNVFAYSLALRTNEVWDTYCRSPLKLWSCTVNLTDHWVEYWAQGYPLPHFYQHLPSILFVALFKLVNLPSFLVGSSSTVSLYAVFRWSQFLILSLFPLSLYWCARKFGFDRLTSAFTGLLSTLISTQFLYGTDLNAVTWRGSGMTTQLLGMVTLPLALGSIYDSLARRRAYARSAVLLALTFHMHLLFGFIASLSLLLLWFLTIIQNLREEVTTPKMSFLQQFTRSARKSFLGPTAGLAKVLLPTALLLSYWLLPLLSHGSLHNTSVWDEQTKFDSYGGKTVILKLLSGDLLDANRLPVLTILALAGFLLALSMFFAPKENPSRNLLNEKDPGPPPDRLIYLFLPALFIFWLTLYFGPATWGKLFYLIPGTEGLHVHRLINGVHFASFFLIAISLSHFARFISSTSTHFLNLRPPAAGFIPRLLGLSLPLLILLPVFKERHKFMAYNKVLVDENLHQFQKETTDLAAVLSLIKTNPLRTNAGRPGNWGRDFKTGGASNFLHLSSNSIPTIGWLPQSWSPFSDIEQFWDGNRLDHYELMNVGWIYSSLTEPLPRFAKTVYEGQTGQLASVAEGGDSPSWGNFHFITVPFTVFGHKNYVLNLERLWLESDWPKAWAFPQLVLTDKPLTEKSRPKRPKGGPVDGPDINLVDLGTAAINGSRFPILKSEIFASSPSALPKGAKIESETKINPHRYLLEVETDQTLALMAKFTYHPYWQIKVDGRENPKFMVAPAFLATPVPPGRHRIEITYTVPPSKQALLALSLITLLLLAAKSLRLLKPRPL